MGSITPFANFDADRQLLYITSDKKVHQGDKQWWILRILHAWGILERRDYQLESIFPSLTQHEMEDVYKGFKKKQFADEGKSKNFQERIDSLFRQFHQTKPATALVAPTPRETKLPAVSTITEPAKIEVTVPAGKIADTTASDASVSLGEAATTSTAKIRATSTSKPPDLIEEKAPAGTPEAEVALPPCVKYESKDGKIYIQANLETLSTSPDSYLDALYAVLERSKNAKRTSGLYELLVRIVDNTGKALRCDFGMDKNVAIFFDDLFCSIASNKGSATFYGVEGEGSSTKIPAAKQRYIPLSSSSAGLPPVDQQRAGRVPGLSQQEKERFQKIGWFFGYFDRGHGSTFKTAPDINTGRYFDEGIFHAITTLTAEEVDTPFDQLGTATLYKMAKGLLQPRADREQNALRILEWVEHIDSPSDEWWKIHGTKEDLEIILNTYGWMFKGDGKFGDIQLSRDEKIRIDQIGDPLVFIQTHQAVLKDALEALCKATVFNTLRGFVENGEGCLATALAPIHAMAKGMKTFYEESLQSKNVFASWNESIYHCNIQDVVNWVQGKLDREEIVSSLHLEHSIYPKQHERLEETRSWLQKWITNPATSEGKLQKFLKWITGRKCCDATITIEEGTGAGTIFEVEVPLRTLKVSPSRTTPVDMKDDSTEEGFIFYLEQAIEREEPISAHYFSKTVPVPTKQ